MDGETLRTCCSIDHVFIDSGVEHFRAHVDDMTRREALAPLAFANFNRKIFKVTNFRHDAELF